MSFKDFRLPSLWKPTANRGNICIEAGNGVKVVAPTEKWLVALIVCMAESHPETFKKVLQTTRGLEDKPTTYICAMVVALAKDDPALFERVLRACDNKVSAYATIPESVQNALSLQGGA